MQTHLNKFKEKFQVEELLIASNDSWNWSVRPAQVTLGASILSLKRPASRLSHITEKEAIDHIKMIKIIENSTSNAFNHNIMNYLMLMMVDHHVHYHVIPRYDGKRNFADLKWQDTDWPAPPNISGSQHANENILASIQEKLRSSL